MNVDVDDRLEAVGIVAGGIVALAGLGTLAGMPWQYGGSAVVTVGQALGAVLAIALGVGLAWISKTE